MSIMDDLRDMLTESVIIKPRTGFDRYGSPSYGAASTYDARIVDVYEELRSARGVVAAVRSHIWVRSTSSDFTRDDLLTHEGSTMGLILSVETFRDDKGVSHTKFSLGERIGEQKVLGGEVGFE